MPRPRSAALNAPRFIAVLARCGNVSAAARAAGLSRSRAYELRAEDPGFAADWDDALSEAVDGLAYEARRRALEGDARPVFYRGEQVGQTRRYSDALLMFLLRAYRPELYAPRRCRRRARQVQALPVMADKCEEPPAAPPVTEPAAARPPAPDMPVSAPRPANPDRIAGDPDDDVPASTLRVIHGEDYIRLGRHWCRRAALIARNRYWGEPFERKRAARTRTRPPADSGADPPEPEGGAAG